MAFGLRLHGTIIHHVIFEICEDFLQQTLLQRRQLILRVTRLLWVTFLKQEVRLIFKPESTDATSIKTPLPSRLKIHCSKGIVWKSQEFRNLSRMNVRGF